MAPKRKKISALVIISTLMLTGFFSFPWLQTVWAVNTTTLSQTINAGTLAVSIVDADGNAVGSPAVAFGALAFSFDAATTTATLGTASEKIRLSNPTATAAWSVTLAGSAPTAVWTDGGSNTFDFNDSAWSQDGADDDTKGGRLAVDSSAGTITGVNGCATTNTSLGSSSAFVETSNNSITLFSSTTAATYCRFELVGVSLSQAIPAAQPAAVYTLGLTLTAS